MVHEYNVTIKNHVYEIFYFIGRLLCMNEKSWTQNGVSYELNLLKYNILFFQ